MVIPAEKKKLTGWGRYAYQESYVFRPEQWRAMNAILKDMRIPDILARGLGRSYGDTAMNEGGAIMNMLRLNRFLSWQEEEGILECEAGVSLREILDVFLPRGWMPHVCPGTKFVTVGGAIANDIHGKNHHEEGSFGNHVISFELLSADGNILQCSRTENADLFWATIGGIGLTGIIRTAKIRLKKVKTAYFHVDYYQAKNLDDLLDKMKEYDKKYPYTVAWLDCLAQKENMGRGVLMGGKIAEVEDLPPRWRNSPLIQKKKMDITVPWDAPTWILSQRTVGIFNSWYYDLNKTRYEIVPLEKFFFPLDRILEWNRMYGKTGFIQYQVVFPGDEVKGLKVLLEQLVSSQRSSFMTVLKRFGAGNEGLLSFPTEGYTLALDIPNHAGLACFVEDLNCITLRYGGRLYLAKDQLMNESMFKETYPRWEEFTKIKEKIDPNIHYSSTMARRLGIVQARRRAPIC
ncbi:MAG: FAD-binding oxidoreductase [Candidatus Hydrogenedens sp.]|nr:FAD-binding oxidoreductase [Candidatus Hydrogenedens sp.]